MSIDRLTADTRYRPRYDLPAALEDYLETRSADRPRGTARGPGPGAA